MNKLLINNAVEWERVLEGWKREKYRGLTDSAPEQYPVVVVSCVETDSYSRDWMNYEFVYMSDFQGT